MNRIENIKTIFFDYDGTLHNSIKIYAPAFRKAYNFLVKEGLALEKQWSEDEIKHWLGYSSKNMWEEFLPDVDEEMRIKASKIVGKEMIRLIEDGKAELYDGALDVLSYLKNKGYTLIFISNCNTYYKEIHNQKFGLDNYFNNMYGSEEFGFIPKFEILSKIINKYEEEMVIIGDRIHDMEAGFNNSIMTIGCSYGFGLEDELKNADMKINNIKKIIEIF